MGCKDAKTKQLINTTMEEETKTKDKWPNGWIYVRLLVRMIALSCFACFTAKVFFSRRQFFTGGPQKNRLPRNLGYLWLFSFEIIQTKIVIQKFRAQNKEISSINYMCCFCGAAVRLFCLITAGGVLQS
jgi:hypothetical protein